MDSVPRQEKFKMMEASGCLWRVMYRMFMFVLVVMIARSKLCFPEMKKGITYTVFITINITTHVM